MHPADAFTRHGWLEHGNVLDPYEVVNVHRKHGVRVLWSEMIETIKKSPLIMNVEKGGVLTTQTGEKNIKISCQLKSGRIRGFHPGAEPMPVCQEYAPDGLPDIDRGI